MDKLPEEVKLIRNSIDSVHGDITSVGANCVRVKTDVSAILEELRDADKVVHDVKTHILGLHAESNNLKGDIHGLKSKAVEVKVVCQGTKDQLGSAHVEISSVAGHVRILKEDVTSVEGKITILQQDMAHIKHEMGLMKSDVTTVKHDLATVKSTVNNINRGIAVIESALVSRCDKVDKQVGTDPTILDEIKSDPGSVDEQTPIMERVETTHSPEQREDNLSGLSSLNTSEVQFKPSAAFLTYQKAQLLKKRVLGKGVQVDSEIDAIPDTEGAVRPKRGGQCLQQDSQTQPSQDYETQDTQETQEEESQADRGLSQEDPGLSQEDPGLSQEDPGLSQEDPGLSQEDQGPSQEETEPSQPLVNVFTHQKKMGLPCNESGQLQWPPQYNVDSLAIVSGKQVDQHGNKFYVVPHDVVRQFERSSGTGTESPTKRSSKRKLTKKK